MQVSYEQVCVSGRQYWHYMEAGLGKGQEVSYLEMEEHVSVGDISRTRKLGQENEQMNQGAKSSEEDVRKQV